MKRYDVLSNQIARRILLIACAVGFHGLAAAARPRSPNHTATRARPTSRCPRGTRRSSWVTPSARRTTSAHPRPPRPLAFAYALFTPEATLFSDDARQVITHFFSPNPSKPTPIRPWWPLARFAPRGSTRGTRAPSGRKVATHHRPRVRRSRVPLPGSLLKVVGAQDGPTGGDTLTKTTFIQRLNTYGGVAPSTGCASSADVGNQAFMPYTADYFFYFDPDK